MSTGAHNSPAPSMRKGTATPILECPLCASKQLTQQLDLNSRASQGSVSLAWPGARSQSPGHGYALRVMVALILTVETCVATSRAGPIIATALPPSRRTCTVRRIHALRSPLVDEIAREACAAARGSPPICATAGLPRT